MDVQRDIDGERDHCNAGGKRNLRERRMRLLARLRRGMVNDLAEIVERNNDLHEAADREQHRDTVDERRLRQAEHHRTAPLLGQLAGIDIDLPGQERKEGQQNERTDRVEPHPEPGRHEPGQQVDAQIDLVGEARRHGGRDRHREQHGGDFVQGREGRVEQPAHQHVEHCRACGGQHPRHAERGDRSGPQDADMLQALEQRLRRSAFRLRDVSHLRPPHWYAHRYFRTLGMGTSHAILC